MQPRAPQRLVGEQVADAGDRAAGRAAAPSAPSSRGRRARGTRRARPRRRPGRRGRSRARSPRGPAGACRAAPAGRRRRTRARSGPSRSCGGSSTTIRPAIPRCRPRSGPPSVSAHRNLPRRWAGGEPVPDQRGGDLARRVRAADVGVGSSTATISRPSARSICWRARSASGSSGIPLRLRSAPHAAITPHLPRRSRAPASASSPRPSGLEADEVFLDLEDAVAPNEKESRARARDRGAAHARLRREDRRRARQRHRHAALLQAT